MPLKGFLKRIMGLENEYGFVALGADKKPDEKQVSSLIQGLGLVGSGATDGFLPDFAARFYIDVGQHPETATPECLGGYQTVIYDRACEIVLLRRLAKMQKANPRHTYWLVKNNLAADVEKKVPEVVFGCHENYLTYSQLDYVQLTSYLTAFMVTRQLWAGSGLVVRRAGSERFNFEIAQRSRHFENIASSSTTNSEYRGIFCMRDEPLADRNRFQRLQVIVGDSNILLTPAVLKLDVTSLLLLMYENGELPCIELNSPIADLKKLTRDWRAGVRLAGGRKVRAVDVQWHYYYAAEQFVAKHNLAQFRPTLARWGKILYALSEEDLDSLYGQVDWVTKQLMIQHRQTDTKPLTYKQAKEIDLLYHTLFGADGLAARLRARHDPPRLSQQVKTALRQPPPTRAAARAQFLEAAAEYFGYVEPGWEILKVGPEGHQTKATLGNPFATTSQSLDKILRRIERNIEEARRLLLIN